MSAKPCLGCGRNTTNGSRCPECQGKLEKRMAATPQARERKRAHTKASNEKYGNPVYKANRKACLERDGNRCVVCGTENALTAHHRIPIWDGGTHALSNLITLCNLHNQQADAAYRSAHKT